MQRGSTYVIMINAMCWLAVLVLMRTSPTNGFVMPRQPIQPTFEKKCITRDSTSNLDTTISTRQSTVILMGAEDNSGSSSEATTSSTSRRRRRKRKVAVKTEDEETKDDEQPDFEEEDIDDTAETPVVTAPAVELKPRDDTPVQLQVKDVREIVGGTIPTEEDKNSGSFLSNIPNPLSAFTDDPSSSSPTTTTTSTSSPTASRQSMMSSSDDSLERLLEDARRMKEEESELSADGGSGGDEASTIKGKIGNVLSTIVTVDFFVVCAFLVWFLLGIFCSSILKDDTVQILFNNNFETLVQPALGVLMIASVAGNFFKEDEEGMEGY